MARIQSGPWRCELQSDGTSGKEPTCRCRRRERLRFHPWVRKIPWRKDDNLCQYSCLENPMDRRAWQATVPGVTKSWTPLKRLSTTTTTVLCISVLLGGFPDVSVVKNLLAVQEEMQETWVWSLGMEDPLEEEMATHSLHCCCWNNPLGRGTWQVTVYCVAKSQSWLSMHTW